MQPEQRLASRSSAPIAIGKPTEVQPVPSQELERLVQPFTGKSIGQRFFGPSGVLEDGTPWIVLVAHNDKRPRGYRQFEKMAMMGWRWDAAPSCLFSLTAIGVDHSRPHTRWLGPSEGPVVAGMRTTGRFLACMANPTGARSGWFEMQFTNGNGPADSRPSTDALESLWIPHAPGIPYSRVGVRFDLEAENAEDRERDQANEIRLWEDPIGDAWVALDYKGPWADDLELPDHKICDWSGYYYRHRSRAAGFIQAIKDRQQLDHHAPLFGAEGVIVKDVPSKSMIDFLVGSPGTELEFAL